MKKYTVTWNKIYCCQSTVEAENEEEAKRIALEGNPDQETFGDNEDIGVEEDDLDEDCDDEDDCEEDEELDKAMDRISWGNGSAVKGGPVA